MPNTKRSEPRVTSTERERETRRVKFDCASPCVVSFVPSAAQRYVLLWASWASVRRGGMCGGTGGEKDAGTLLADGEESRGQRGIHSLRPLAEEALQWLCG